MNGIDLSHWNQLEHFWLYENDFVIAKLTEGKTMTDYTAFTYYAMAKSIEIPFGVYHFGHPEKNTVQEELTHLTTEYKKFKNKNISIWLDIEGKALGAKNLDAWCHEWLTKAEKLTNKAVGLYISQANTRKFDLCKKFPLWVARYRKKELGYGVVIPWQEATIWQYDAKTVDKDICYKEEIL